jgi:hypothetical protein
VAFRSDLLKFFFKKYSFANFTNRLCQISYLYFVHHTWSSSTSSPTSFLHSVLLKFNHSGLGPDRERLDSHLKAAVCLHVNDLRQAHSQSRNVA